MFIINIVVPIVLCWDEVGRWFDPFYSRLCSVFLSVFSLSLLHVVVGRRLVCDLWHFFPDHPRILVCALDKAPIMVS